MAVSRMSTTSWLLMLGINYMDHETCNELHDDDIVYDIVYDITYSVMLYSGVPRGGEEGCQGNSAAPLSIEKHRVGKAGSMRRLGSWADSEVH
jgi:hypothetical protein